MDASNIPKSFWNALSFCMVVATVGLVFIAYRSADVSIEIADAKINLSSALTEVSEIKGDLERENERLTKLNARLIEANETLQARLEKAGIETPVGEGLEGLKTMEAGEGEARRKLLDSRVFESINERIDRVKSAIRN